MAWDGWIEFGGNEIVNVSRIEKYAENMQWHALRPQYNNDDLALMLNDGEYRTPLLDDAPWMDDDAAESSDFLGLYPLDIQGLESATRQAEVYESIADGGSVRGVRHGTKSMVFQVALCALSPAGAEYGFRWLKQVLNGNPCGGGTDGMDCSGTDLCYLATEPLYDPYGEAQVLHYDFPDDGYGEGGFGEGPYGDPFPREVSTPGGCFEKVQRTLRNVTVTQGPIVNSKRVLSDGSAVWVVAFTAVAGNPYEFGPDIPIIQGFLDPHRTTPWADGVYGGTYDDHGFVWDEVQCPVPVYSPVFDPLCPALVPPPPPASVALGCFTPPQNWIRRQITIPKQFVPLWGDVVPLVSVSAGSTEVRSLRLRFYTDLLNTGNPNIDPCSYCGDVVISYVPVNSTLVFDAASQQVYIQDQKQNRRRADSLVFKTDGTPFDWPVLSCGMGYVVTFDLPQTQSLPVIDLSLVARVI